MIISLDFSINSPGVCILTDDNRLEFLCFPRVGVSNDKVLQNLKDSGVHVYEMEALELFDTDSLSSYAALDLENAFEMADEIINRSIEVNNGNLNVSKNILCIENFSYGSSGKRLIQLVGHNYIFRSFAVQKILKSSFKIFVFSPMTIKSIAFSEFKNADWINKEKKFSKDSLIKYFMLHQNRLPQLDKNKFYLDLKNNPEKYSNKNGKFYKPVDDLIDSYWLLKTYFNNNETK